MPLRVRRTDDITPLSPHPNDPAWQKQRSGSSVPKGDGLEFLTLFTVAVPADAVPGTLDAVTA
jgi:hypothetical protein